LSFFVQNKEGNWIKTLEEIITANDIFEKYALLKYTLYNFGILALEAIYINSKINFYGKKINQIEEEIKKINEIVSILDNSLSSLESM
jgi:hypothetical protein